MQANAETVMKECTEGSDSGTLTFPEVVAKLMGAGVERYHADIIRAEKTYYLPDGSSSVVGGAAVATPAAQAFDPGGVENAVRAIRARHIDYKEFCERIAAAGCVGYLVSLVGRKAVYYGRGGDNYVEPFPRQ